MENDNPAEMSNQDLEKAMEQSGSEELVNKSSASEGKLLTPENDPASVQNLGVEGTAGKLDSAGNIITEDSQDGSLPDPEEVKLWEADDSGDKTSS